MAPPKQSELLLLLSVAMVGCNGQQTPTTFDPLGGKRAEPSKSTAHAWDTLFLPRPVAVESRTTSSLRAGSVRCGLQDKAGHLWFGTWEGLVRYDGRDFTLFKGVDSLSGERGYVEWEHIYCLYEDKAGNIWFGTPNGVGRYDPSASLRTGGQAFANFSIPAGGFADLSDYANEQSRVLSPIFPTTVLSILEDMHGHLWFGTHGGGVLHYDPSASLRTGGNVLSRLSATDGLCNNVVQDMLEDSTGNLWFATRGGGVCRYDGRSFTSFKADDVVGNHVFFISADRTGVLWIGTVGGGLRRFDGTTFVPVTEPQMLNATSMLEASNGDRWFSSDGFGAIRYEGSSYTRFTTKDGLCATSVWTIVEDKDHNLWFCTREGLCRYDGRSFTGFAGY